MILEKYTLTPTQFNAIPDADRALLVLLAHGLNEINAFEKLLGLAVNIPRGNKAVELAHSCQAMVLVRTLAGKLHTMNRLIEVCFRSTVLSPTYRALADQTTLDALKRLDLYFGPPNLITTIRNQLAFRYQREHGLKKIDVDQPADDLALYLHKRNENSLYQFAELVMTVSLTSLVPASQGPDGTFVPVNESAESPEEDALLTILSETRYVSVLINAFSHGMIFAILHRHIGTEVLQLTRQQVDVENAVKHGDVTIPFFVEFPD